MLVDLLNVTSPVIGKQQAANPKILPATMQNMHPAASKPSNIKKPNHMMMNPQVRWFYTEFLSAALHLNVIFGGNI